MYPLTWFLLVLTITGLTSATNTVPVLNMTQYAGRWYVVSKDLYSRNKVKYRDKTDSFYHCTGC